jgi:hypothetical protein
MRRRSGGSELPKELIVFNLRIEFGTLHDVFAKAATWDGLSIVPAMVELNGTNFSTCFHLRDVVGQHRPAILARPIEQQYDAAWVRARLPRVFAFTPDVAEVAPWKRQSPTVGIH